MSGSIPVTWEAPARVRAVCTTRRGGVSTGAYDSLNLADHVGDLPGAVTANRQRLVSDHRLPAMPLWLDQVHGTGVCRADSAAPPTPRCDASVAVDPGVVCAVLTADCLPVLLCDRAGTCVAAAHAGWRGLAGGVLEATVRAMPASPLELMAWLGPAIGPERFEVGEEVRAAFVDSDPAAAVWFARNARGRWLADLYGLARQRLSSVGVAAVSGGGLCTYADAARFYSYRRDGVTGRMAALVWLAP